MNTQWQREIDALLTREGGDKEHPNDLGGPTHWGMTLKTYRGLMGDHTITEDQLRSLARGDVGELYYEYWVKHRRLRLDLLMSMNVAASVLDASILFSRARAAKWLQMAYNELSAADLTPLKVDGWIGEQTRYRLVGMPNHRRVVSKISEYRIKRHVMRVRQSPEQIVFLGGWINRAFEVSA